MWRFGGAPPHPFAVNPSLTGTDGANGVAAALDEGDERHHDAHGGRQRFFVTVPGVDGFPRLAQHEDVLPPATPPRRRHVLFPAAPASRGRHGRHRRHRSRHLLLFPGVLTPRGRHGRRYRHRGYLFFLVATVIRGRHGRRRLRRVGLRRVCDGDGVTTGGTHTGRGGWGTLQDAGARGLTWGLGGPFAGRGTGRRRRHGRLGRRVTWACRPHPSTSRGQGRPGPRPQDGDHAHGLWSRP